MFVNPEPARGPWFRSQFPGQCSRGREYYSAGETIRADGHGDWECYDCVADAGDD